MHQNAFFSTNSRSSNQSKNKKTKIKNDAKTLFPTLHPLSPVIFATATVVAFVLLSNSRFSSHCYTQREATPTQKSARKWHCDLSRLVARKITKGIHSCKPASLKRPIADEMLAGLPPFLCLSDLGWGGNGGVRSQATRRWVNTITELYHQPGVSAERRAARHNGSWSDQHGGSNRIGLLPVADF